MKDWAKTGLSWGLAMFIIMVFVFPYFEDGEITTKRILLGAVLWTVLGLLFGYSLRKRMIKK